VISRRWYRCTTLSTCAALVVWTPRATPDMWSPLSRPRSACPQAIALWELLSKRFQAGLGQELEKHFAFSVVGPSSHDIRLRTCGRGFIVI
jgi:hypothetical protein